MAKSALHVLTWSAERQCYDLATAGQRRQCFEQEDKQAWLDWLSQQTSFAFQGRHGHISVLKETRSRGAGYWYAYSTRSRQTNKRYLGPLSRVTLERLEEVAQALTAESGSAPRTKQRKGRHFPAAVAPAAQPEPAPLLASKQVPPQLPTALVQRERLLPAMNAVFASRLLLLSAAAGSGKTTLLSAWVARSIQAPNACIWLSLDELDNNPTRFWTLIVTALHTCMPAVGEAALGMLYSPQPPLLSTMLTTLLNDLTGLSREVVLVLDDYQVIDDPNIHESLSFWLDHLPASFHVVLSSRVDPTLPLARWRVRGQLVEIRDADLRFTMEEASSFLTQALGRAPSEEAIVLLESRTEGWIAGLQLAVLALRKHDDLSMLSRAFAGNHRYLLDYVQEEILQRLPLAVQDFLLQTAVLTRLHPALCQAVTGAGTLQASQELLDGLERDNLFVVPLDEQRQWYRFHELFRDILLARLRASQPQLVPLLHRRAARWYAGQGLVHETMAHALAASDYSFAASVLEREASQLWLRGEAKTISTWVLALPDATLREYLDFALLAALKPLDLTQNMPEQQWTEARTQSEQIMVRLKQVLQSEWQGSPSEIEMGRIRNRLSLLHGLIDTRTVLQEGNIQEVRRLAQQMRPLAAQESAAWKKIPLSGLFMSAQVLGDGVLLLPDLLAVKQQALQEQDRATALVVMCWLAGALLYAGHLRALQQECLHVQEMQEILGSQIAIAAYPSLDLAFLFYTWNQLHKAQISLQQAIEHARQWQDMTVLVWSYSLSVKVFLAAGKLAEAEQALQEARRLIQETGLTVYASEVMAAQVSLWLAHGDLSAAGAWASHFLRDATPSEYIHTEEYLALARVYLAQEQYASCLRLLTQLLGKMETMKRQWDVVQILALQILALHGCGEVTQARQVTIRLLTLTEPEGYIRVYVDAGKAMQRVLQSFLDTPEDDAARAAVVSLSAVSTVLAAFEQEQSWSALSQQPRHAPAEYLETLTPTQASSLLIEPLSPREQEVLRLVAEGASNQEIADHLVLSLTTVKKHVGSLLLKLTAENRTRAVARARELSLL
ncbi:MAG: LuxR C-terminal-related transcriptional regulator [Chloroflexota bacterium]|nr:LuxR C-terminal-related transcriptional regulator [Chloroflexota bacterium]